MHLVRHPQAPAAVKLFIYCPECSEKNPLSLAPGTGILDHKLTCRGCARVVTFSVMWHPEVVTFRKVEKFE